MLDKIAGWIIVLQHPELNVWDDEPESGIDHDALPDLTESTLGKLMVPSRREPPIPWPPAWVMNNRDLIGFLSIFLFPILWLPLMFVQHGEDVLEAAKNNPPPPIPELPWGDVAKLARERNTNGAP